MCSYILAIYYVLVRFLVQVSIWCIYTLKHFMSYFPSIQTYVSILSLFTEIGWIEMKSDLVSSQNIFSKTIVTALTTCGLHACSHNPNVFSIITKEIDNAFVYLRESFKVKNLFFYWCSVWENFLASITRKKNFDEGLNRRVIKIYFGGWTTCRHCTRIFKWETVSADWFSPPLLASVDSYDANAKS